MKLLIIVFLFGFSQIGHAEEYWCSKGDLSFLQIKNLMAKQNSQLPKIKLGPVNSILESLGGFSGEYTNNSSPLEMLQGKLSYSRFKVVDKATETEISSWFTVSSYQPEGTPDSFWDPAIVKVLLNGHVVGTDIGSPISYTCGLYGVAWNHL